MIGPVGIVHLRPTSKFRERKYGYLCRGFWRQLGKERFQRRVEIGQQFCMRVGLIRVRIEATKTGRKHPDPKVGIDQVCRHQQLALQPRNPVGNSRPRRCRHG
jgi:hypothetical protein